MNQNKQTDVRKDTMDEQSSLGIWCGCITRTKIHKQQIKMRKEREREILRRKQKC